MKILTILLAIFVTILSVAIVIAAWPLMPQMALLAIGLTFVFAVGAGLVGLYYWLGRAKIQHATAYSLTLEAGKIAATNSVLVLNKQLIQLPQWTQPSLPTVAGPALVEPTSEPLELPTAPAWSDVLAGGFEPTPKNLLLGFDHAGPVYGDLTALLSTAVAGRPGQGKSSLLRLVAAQMQAIGGLTALLDPHGSISEDVPIDAVFNACTGSELDDAAYWLINELERRLANYRKGKRDFRPLMALNDEFPVISLASKNAVAAVGRVVLEGRKVKMFSLISGQGLPASQFGGSLIRDALSSRYIFQTTNRQGQLAGLDKDAAKLLDRLDVGRCILDGPIKPRIVAIPLVRSTDLLAMGQPDSKPMSQATPAQDSRFEDETINDTFSTKKGSESRSDRSDVVTAQYRELELPAAPGELEHAWQAYKSGAKTVRSMQAALGCSTSKAGSLLADLRRIYGVN